MKKFILVILAYILPIMAVLYGIQYKMDDVGRHRVSQMKNALSRGIDADILITGNSRAQCSYNTVIMDSVLNMNCYNLGMIGRPFDFEYNLLIEPYLRRNKTPKIIIQEVSPHAFFKHWNDKFDYEYLPFINLPEYEFYVDVCDEVTLADKILPIKYRGIDFPKLYRMYRRWCNDTISLYKDGYAPRPNTHGYQKDFVDSPYSVERDQYMEKLFTHFVRECDSLNIQLVLVISPMHMSDFYNYCDMDGFKRLIDSLSAGSNALFLDYSHMFGDDTLMMQESTHLSYAGSCVFSEKIANDLRNALTMHFKK